MARLNHFPIILYQDFVPMPLILLFLTPLIQNLLAKPISRVLSITKRVLFWVSGIPYSISGIPFKAFGITNFISGTTDELKDEAEIISAYADSQKGITFSLKGYAKIKSVYAFLISA